MPVNYKAELVGAFGDPIAENPTGIMQEAAFAATGLNWCYLLLEVNPDNLADAVRGAKALGMRGFNLTIPHKVAVIPLLDEVAPDARLIGAVNTVQIVDGRLIGSNTDGKGFLRGLREVTDPAGKRVVILGAGGAARAIAVELALAGAAAITIVNRKPERGQMLASHLQANTEQQIEFVHWTQPYEVDASVDILVNATSIGLYPNVDAIPEVILGSARPDLIVCDVIPNPPVTPLIRAAQARGMTTLTGLPMLVYQGAIGFELWTGVPAPEAVMMQALEQAFEI